MDLTATYSSVSGPRLRDCATLINRYPAGDQGFLPERGETWICRSTPDGKSETLYRHTGWLTGLWRSETGKLYATDIRRRVLQGHVDSDEWRQSTVPINPMGIWGLRDDCVFAWGMADGRSPAVARWDGEAWSQLPAPAELVVAMHGVADDEVFAVGDEGMAAHWNGSSWSRKRTPGAPKLTRVFVAGPDEVYTCGPGGELFRGGRTGWTSLCSSEHRLSGVAKWNDELWVATGGPLGLCKWDGSDALVSIKDNLQALQLDARDDLVMITRTHVVGTADGQLFKGLPTKWFLDVTKRHSPSWE